MRGGAVDLTVLQGLVSNPSYVCGSTRIDQATALGKIEAYDSIYVAVRGAGAGGRQAAIAGVVTAAQAAVAGGAGVAADNYIIAHPNYVGLYKSGGNFYTVAINKAPGTVASNPGNAAVAAGAAAPPAPRAAIVPPGPLLTAAGAAGAGAVVPADYIIVEA